jgi:DNA-binding transcriptional MerR regulator
MTESSPRQRRHLDISPPPPRRGSEPARAAEESYADMLEPGQLLQVGELAKATGKTVRAIHLYEDLGILTPVDRSKGRYRLFSSEALLRVRWISKLQSLGFSLSEIQEIVRDHEDADDAMGAAARLRERYLDKLSEARSKICELMQLESELEESLLYLNACDTTCVPSVQVESCPTCERHPDEKRQAPDLIAGVHAN